MNAPVNLSQDSNTDLDTPSSTTSSSYRFGDTEKDIESIQLSKKRRIWECLHSSEDSSPEVQKSAKEGHGFHYAERRGAKVFK